VDPGAPLEDRHERLDLRVELLADPHCSTPRE
jgi:hypothetical protein